MKNLNAQQRAWVISQVGRVGVNALSNDSVLQYKASCIASNKTDDSASFRVWCVNKCGGRALANLTDKELSKLENKLNNEVKLWK